MDDYFEGSAVKDLIIKIIPDSFPDVQRVQVISDLEASFDDDSLYKGSDVLLLLQSFVSIIYEESDKAIVEVSEEAVQKAVAPILGEVAGLTEKVELIGSGINLTEGLLYVCGGVILGMLAKTAVDALLNKGG